MQITESELTYARNGEQALLAVLYQPERPNNTFLIDVHGGAWSSGDRKSGRYYDRRLAETGITILAIDFSDGPEHHHPAASADVCAAVRFVRTHYASDKLGLIGSSSGGHLALLAALKPDVPEHRATEIASGTTFISSETTAGVDFVIALWPVSNPIARYQYVTAWAQQDKQLWGSRFQPDRLAEGHLAYFTNTDNMNEASIQRILQAGEHQALPPVFIVQPALDQNVPVFMSETLLGAILDAGGEALYRVYPDVPHGFAHVAGPQTEQCLEDIQEFINIQ